MDKSPKWLFKVRWRQYLFEWTPGILYKAIPKEKPAILVNYLLYPFLQVGVLWSYLKDKYNYAYDRLNDTRHTYGLQNYLRKAYDDSIRIIEGNYPDKVVQKRYFMTNANWYFKDTADVYLYRPVDHLKDADFIIQGDKGTVKYRANEIRADVNMMIPLGSKYLITEKT